MGSCVIFCAGELDSLPVPIAPADYLLAADGGLRHCRRLGLSPHEILGDFDSLGYTPENARVYPVEKDDTDTMLAARRGLELGYREFYFYGSLDGPRLDHTVANFQTLHFLADRGAWGFLIGKTQIVTLLREGELRFPAAARGTISLFCQGPDAQGVTIRGLQYPLEEGTLTCGFPLGVSNHFTGREARVSVRQGSLLVIWDREAGFPEFLTPKT